MLKKHPARETIFKKAIRRCESKAIMFLKRGTKCLFFPSDELWVTISDRQLAQGHCESVGQHSLPGANRGTLCVPVTKQLRRKLNLPKQCWFTLFEWNLIWAAVFWVSLSSLFYSRIIWYVFSSLKSSSYSTCIFFHVVNWGNNKV